MADFKIGVIVDSFKLDLMDGIKKLKRLVLKVYRCTQHTEILHRHR
jgi:hypothetical protein